MVLSGESTRRLNVILSLQDKMSGQVKQAERNLTSFRTEIRRASIALGTMSASLGLTLRSWVQSSNETRQALANIGATLSALGRDPSQILPDLAPTFDKISKDVGKSIAAIAANFNELLLATGNPEFSLVLLRIASGIEAITDKELDMRILANAIAGDRGAVEAFRALTGLDLSSFTTTADRIKAVSDWVEKNLPASVTKLDTFRSAWENLKAKLGEVVVENISGPLSFLAGVFERLSQNKDLVTFGATFTAVAAGVAILGAALAGIAWIAVGNPLGLALTAIATGIGLVVAALATWKEKDPEGFAKFTAAFKDLGGALAPLATHLADFITELATVLAKLTPLAPLLVVALELVIAPIELFAKGINAVIEAFKTLFANESTFGERMKALGQLLILPLAAILWPFTTILEHFGLLEKAADGIKRAVEGMKTVLSATITWGVGALNSLIGNINSVIGAINRAIEAFNNLPGPNLPTVPTVPTVPTPTPPVPQPPMPPSTPEPLPPPYVPPWQIPPVIPPPAVPPPYSPPTQPPNESPNPNPPPPPPPFDPGPPPYNPGPGAPPELMTARGGNIIINSFGDIDADRRIRLQVESALRAGWGIA